MSRIGKKPIAGAERRDGTVDGNAITVKGPKGELTRTFPADMPVAHRERHR